MENLNIRIQISPTLYAKDPESSDLGRHIICKSIEMINTLGFESFTFKKLGEAIGSNESSVYRYFANKHTLLIYLVNWYWSWMDYKIVLQTANIDDPKEKIMHAIELLAADIKQDSDFSFINEVLLNKIIIMESWMIKRRNCFDGDLLIVVYFCKMGAHFALKAWKLIYYSRR